MVDQRVIVTSFLKAGISNALDGSEDDALWQTEKNVFFYLCIISNQSST